MPNEITKPTQSVVKGHRITVSPLAARLAEKNAKKAEESFSVRPNRIALILDLSGSMDLHESGKAKIVSPLGLPRLVHDLGVCRDIPRG